MSLSRRAMIMACPAIFLARNLGGDTSAAWYRGEPQPATSIADADMAEWRVFMDRFVTTQGRVVDTGNGGVSHTEGQGIGMLATAMFGDEVSFRLLLDWTEQTLRHREDSLHAWRYLPRDSDAVPDSNPATDGEILIAYALFVAANRWNRADYVQAGEAIARDVLDLLVRRSPRRNVLLPGMRGFENRSQIVVNPSYYLFPAFQCFARQTHDMRWQALHDDGIALLREARFGRWGLAPDWLSVPRDDGPCVIAAGRPARFSYDAVRLPLYMAWAGHVDEPAVTAALSFWVDAPAAAWADLRSNDVAPYAMASGMVAIRAFVRTRAEAPSPLTLPSVQLAPGYYDAALTMLVRVAAVSSPGTAAGGLV